MLIIHREGWSHAERAVRVTQDTGGCWWVNPQTQVAQVVGQQTHRLGCIISFADGLKQSGHDVMINDRRRDKWVTRGRRLFVGNAHPNILIYWIFGFAWGSNKWESLELSLKRYVAPGQRLTVLEETAQHFINRPWERLRLITPLI